MTTSIFIPGASFTVTTTLDLVSTTGSNIGVITKASGVRFIHDYNNGTNLFVGRNAGNFTATGTNNLGYGTNALTIVSSGSRNIGMGMNTLDVCTTGNDTIAIGDNAGGVFVSGDNNIFIGSNAGSSSTATSNNIFIGSNSGTAITTTSGNICLDNVGVVGDTGIIRIGTAQTKVFITGIRGVTTDVADGIPLYISSTGQIGTAGATASAVTTMSAFGNTPNVNGATITGNNLQLQPADVTNPGGVSITDQTFNGIKTFDDGIRLTTFTTTLSTYSQAVVAMTWTGAAVGANNATFERIGNIVFMSIIKVFSLKAVAGAGASIDGTGAVPAEFIPAAERLGSLMIFSSTRAFAASDDEYVQGVFQMNTSGVINIYPGITTTTDTPILFLDAGSGAYNGFMSQVITYRV